MKHGKDSKREAKRDEEEPGTGGIIKDGDKKQGKTNRKGNKEVEKRKGKE